MRTLDALDAGYGIGLVCGKQPTTRPHLHAHHPLKDAGSEPARTIVNRRTPDAGVYLLASDAVWQWLSACAESLRSFNPDLRVVVIPNDNELRIIKRL